MAGTHYISVILPLRLEWEPYYSVPAQPFPDLAATIRTGDRVKVDFAGREYLAVVSRTDVTPTAAANKIKPIKSVETAMARIFPEEISLWKKVAEYYLCTVGEVYKAAYPYGKINSEETAAAAKAREEERLRRTTENLEKRIILLKSKLQKREELLQKARKENSIQKYTSEIESIKTSISETESALQSLRETAGRTAAATDTETGTDNGVMTSREAMTDTIVLSEAQHKAYKSIKEGFAQNKPVMLKGLTGSGKTEIYIKLAFEAMAKGLNVLYLVPEIAISRQLEDRLRTHFGSHLLVFHSGEQTAAKRHTAEILRQAPSYPGAAPHIVLGTRSSIFLPHNRLGLIIVDEEHDSSYKQDSPAPRYNGRDTALMLSLIHSTPERRCDILLGSATPSLEEIYNCYTGKHVPVNLSERYHGSEDTDIEIIDTNAERKKRGMAGNFSIKLIRHIQNTLAAGGQIIILRSRRAWAPALQCANCGEIQKCPHCNVSLSYHHDTPNAGTAQGEMVCHYCGYKSTYTGKCAKCSGNLRGLGAGTQKIEDEAARLFPEARIARLDSDTKQSKSYETKVIRDFSKGSIDILVGTQIITKGFDFSNLRLVAVIAADSLLGIQDFRADEKAMQVLEQFRGRCGRRAEKGLLVIQTSQPEHPVYRRISGHESAEFSMELLRERQEFNFPPFTRIIEISVKDRDEGQSEEVAHALVQKLRKHFDADKGTFFPEIVGPYAPAVSKISDLHIRMIRISLRKDKRLAAGKAAIKAIVNDTEKTSRGNTAITINVDPS